MERVIWEHGLCPNARGTENPFDVKSRWDAAWITAAQAENAVVVNYILPTLWERSSHLKLRRRNWVLSLSIRTN